MPSHLPIDEEYLSKLRENTLVALDWLLAEINDGPASSHHEEFTNFRSRISTLALAELASQAPAIEDGPHSVLSEWDYADNPVFREQWCRAEHYHKKYFNLVSSFSLYHKYRITRNIELPNKDDIESDILARLNQVDEEHRLRKLSFWHQLKEKIMPRKRGHK